MNTATNCSPLKRQCLGAGAALEILILGQEDWYYKWFYYKLCFYSWSTQCGSVLVSWPDVLCGGGEKSFFHRPHTKRLFSPPPHKTSGRETSSVYALLTLRLRAQVESKILLFPVRVRIVSALHKVIKGPFNSSLWKKNQSGHPKIRVDTSLRGFPDSQWINPATHWLIQLVGRVATIEVTEATASLWAVC